MRRGNEKSMNKYYLFMLMAFILCMSYPLVIPATEPEPDGSDILINCSLALDMSQDKYRGDVIKGAKPMPTNEQQREAHACANYVSGFKDAVFVNQLYFEKKETQYSICLPYDSINNGQAIQIAVKYAHDHPEDLRLPRAVFVFKSLLTAFPCKK